MRAVNLLPEGQRPHAPSGKYQGSAYFVVGTLALVLVALVSYVLVANQVTSRTAQAEQAGQDADAAEAKAAKLGAFGSFAQIKEAREAGVRATATERFDWERLSREMARVIPTDIFITELDAFADPENADAGAASKPAGAGAKEAEGPHMKLVGCALSQKDVATTMVRLRALHRAVDVTLEESALEDDEGAATSPSPTPAPAAPAAPGAAPATSGAKEETGCGTTNFKPNYEFTLHVDFEKAAPAAAPEAAPRVPSSLGGGA